jgi:DNA invertase Pin-like site-specific DNA recombinase
MTRRVTPDPTRAVAYLRVSTAGQDNGLTAQRDGIEAWAAREGVTIVAWHLDRVSGATALDKRPAMTAALADLTTHRAGLLVAWRRDRLARDPVVAGMLEAAVGRLRARVVTADGAANGDDLASEAMRGMLDVVARMERRLIAARTSEALRAKRARGEAPGGTAPYGYRIHDGRLVPDPAEIHAIDRLITLRREGYPARVIATRLELEGVPWPRAKRWSTQTVWRILKSQTKPTTTETRA